MFRAEQIGRCFADPDDIFKYISLKENVFIFIPISLKFVPRGSIESKFNTDLDDGSAVLSYQQFYTQEHISMELHSKFKHFHSQKCIWKCHLQNASHFVPTLMW